jgi:hypothetical protein
MDISEVLNVAEIEPNELAHLLMEVFPNIRQEESDVFYSKGGDEWAVRLRYSGDTLTIAESGAQFTVQDQTMLHDRVRQALLDEPVLVIGREIVYTKLPVTSHLRVDDLFQLLPIPDDAPKANSLFADHPAILEVPYLATRAAWLDGARYHRASRELELILNILLHGGIRLATRYRGNRWVLIQPSFKPEAHALGYHLSSWTFDSRHYSDAMASAAMPLVERNEYYARATAMPPAVQDAPADARALIRTFYGLASKERQTILRAAHWYLHAQEARSSSLSGALVALICAIECLMPPLVSGGKGPTARFRDFMENMFPTDNEGDLAARKELYNLRSRLSHGDNLLRRDFNAEYFIHPATVAESDQLYYASTLARFAIINWLDQHALVTE